MNCNLCCWSWMGFVLMVTVFVGCQPEVKSTAPLVSALAPVDIEENSREIGEAGKDEISHEQAIEYASRWVKAIETNNANQTELLFDWRGLVERAVEGLNVLPKMGRSTKNSGLTAALSAKLATRMLEELNTDLQAGGSYRLVRVAKRGGAQHALFRLIGADNSINYHDLRITRTGGSLRADRFFVAMTGEELADTIRTELWPGLQEQNSASFRFSGQAKEESDGYKKLQSMMNAARAGDASEAKRIFNSLPTSQRQRKLPLLAMIIATDIADEAAYLAAVDNFTKQFPNDPAIGFVSLDSAMLRKDPVLLEKSRKSVQQWTGGDVYLDLMVGGILIDMGQVEEAMRLTKDLEPEPLGLAIAHEFKLSIAVASKDHARVLKELSVLEDVYGYEFEDLRQAEGYEEFVTSPDFETWMSRP